MKAQGGVTEDVCDGTMQVRTAKPVSGMDNYPPQTEEGYFFPVMGNAGGGNGLPSHALVNGEATAMATGTVPIQGLLDPGIQQVQQGRARPCSLLSQGRSKQIQSDPLSS